MPSRRIGQKTPRNDVRNRRQGNHQIDSFPCMNKVSNDGQQNCADRPECIKQRQNWFQVTRWNDIGHCVDRSAREKSIQIICWIICMQWMSLCVLLYTHISFDRQWTFERTIRNSNIAWTIAICNRLEKPTIIRCSTGQTCRTAWDFLGWCCVIANI